MSCVKISPSYFSTVQWGIGLRVRILFLRDEVLGQHGMTSWLLYETNNFTNFGRLRLALTLRNLWGQQLNGSPRKTLPFYNIVYNVSFSKWALDNLKLA